MIELLRAASEVQAVCESERWRYCFIGGLALQQWGEPRETIDVDLTLLTGFGREEEFAAKLLARFSGRIDGAAAFARDKRVLLLRSSAGVGIDVAFGALPFEEGVVSRSVLIEFPKGPSLRLCSPEDLVVLKAFAARPRDWLDIEGVIVRQSGKLDWPYIMSQLQPLAELKEAPEIVTELQRRRAELER
ncbi:MAG: nucleotidyl transferase AbiEii/AbiGii toxin family protein [Elusimicrobia bacterium]|nr:nucleotidyl transferase AbiEii/AbiGii toxin family protein [Elusimicrobiota bacterium]